MEVQNTSKVRYVAVGVGAEGDLLVVLSRLETSRIKAKEAVAECCGGCANLKSLYLTGQGGNY